MKSERRSLFWRLLGWLAFFFLAFLALSSQVLGVQFDYTLTTVALGGGVLGLISGTLGAFAVLRQESLLGDALSHAALPGVAVGFLLFGRELGALLLGAAAASWLAVLFVQAITDTTRLKRDAAIGIVLAAFFALGIVLMTYIQGRPDASQAGLDTFIFGQAAAIVRRDVQLISAAGLIAILCLALLWKEFKLITFDPEFARANGFPVRALEIALSTLIVAAIVLGLQLAGVILMVGLLIAPAVAARQWTKHLEEMVVLSGVFGAFSGAIGAIISGVDAGLPTGPLIIIVAFGIVIVSLAVAPERGVIWQWAKQWRDQRQFVGLLVLRDIYHYAQQHQDIAYPVPEGVLIALRGRLARVGLAQLARDGYIQSLSSRCWSLTAEGAALAAEDAHNLALWSAYRRYNDELILPAITQDYSRDIHDLLPPDAIRQLEQILQEGDYERA